MPRRMARAGERCRAARRACSRTTASLAWSTLLLLALGLVMVYSASIAIAEGGRAHRLSRRGTSSRAMRMFLAIGVVAAVVAFQVPMRLWQQAAPYLFIVGVVLLVLVLIPGIGREVNGSRRWLSLVRRQPPAVGADEALRRALRRRLHGAQGGVLHAQLQQTRAASCRCSS